VTTTENLLAKLDAKSIEKREVGHPGHVDHGHEYLLAWSDRVV